MKYLSVAFVCLLFGCKIPDGRIVSVTQSVIGIKVGENPATQTPELQIGFFRSTFQIVPTSTNGPITAPKVNSSLSLSQKSFATEIQEDFETDGAAIPSSGSPSVARLGILSRSTNHIIVPTK